MPDPLTIDREAVAEACRKYGVKRLAVFGSAVTTNLDPSRSDVDFLVEFLPSDARGLEGCFGLKHELEALLGRPVDLVSPRALDIRTSLPRCAAPKKSSMQPSRPRRNVMVGRTAEGSTTSDMQPFSRKPPPRRTAE